MFVRAMDKRHNRYYKSMVYGLINVGYYEQAILFNPFTNCFELVDYLEKGTKELLPLYYCINDIRNDWISIEKAQLLKFKKFLKDKSFEFEIKLLQGYAEVINDYNFIYEMLKNKETVLADTTQKIRSNEDEQEWHYIKSQKDADEFMKIFVGFHDSTMDRITYEENYGKKQLNIIFDNSGWYGVAELCFEGLIRMNLQSFGENCSREIYEATFHVTEEMVYWADGETEPNNIQFNGTWVKALNCKWKRIG